MAWDYIVIGAGSAGCIMAERLSRDPNSNVLLLEAGPKDSSPWVHLPLGYGKLFFHEKMNWRFDAQAEEALDGRVDYWPRGKVVGGSGAINAMVYARGLPHDYDDWAAAGATGWGWDDVAPVFDQLETRVDADGKTHGSGPIHVQDIRRQIHPITRHFFTASDRAGYGSSDDYNGSDPIGAAVYQINTKGGLRCATGQAFLRPALRRANLRLITGALVQRITFDGTRASGVTYTHGGSEHTAQAAGEVVLCAGAVASPMILQRSGIGAGSLLQSHGIDTVIDQPNVGQNLQDHLGVSYYFKSTEPSLNNQLAPLWGKAWAALQFAFARRGPLALSVNQTGGYFKTNPALARPDIQMYFNPVTYSTRKAGHRPIINPDPFGGFIIGFSPTRPQSRGEINISGPTAADAPQITPNSLSHPDDAQTIIAGGQLCQNIMQTDVMQALVKSPLNHADLRGMTADDLLADFRARCGTVYHANGTCRMGADATTSVVDPQLRVHGAQGLRVVDASVFPNITSANTNAPTMMVAMRAADIMTGAPA